MKIINYKRCQVLLSPWQLDVVKQVEKECGLSFSATVRAMVSSCLLGGTPFGANTDFSEFHFQARKAADKVSKKGVMINA